MDLNFDVYNMFVSNELEEFSDLANMLGSKCKVYSSPFYYTFKQEHLESFDRVRREFVRRVDQRMMQLQGDSSSTVVDSLKLDFLLGSQHKDIIDKWISIAIAKGAQHIELLLSNRPYGMPTLIHPYIFPHALFTHFQNHLHLQNCHLILHPDEFVGFKNLKSLVLEELQVEKELLLCLFSKCFHLQDLTFKMCQFNTTTNFISPTLRNLKIISCQIPSKMDIVTSNLSSLEFAGDTTMVFSSINAPQLTKFYLNSYCRYKEFEELEVPHYFALLTSIHQLQNLSIILSTLQVCM
jgi:hypothetical protein